MRQRMRRLSNGLGVAIAEGRGLRTVALSLSVLGLAALVVAPAAGAKTRIVWSRFARTGPKQRLVSARPNGTHLQKLTHPGKHSQDIDASISPDGTRVLFERDFLNAEISRVAVVGGNGQNEHPLDLGCVDPCVADLTPTWLPAGDRFAFTPIIGPFDAPHQSASSAVLHTARSNGTDIQRLSQPGIDGKFEDYRARFSRDGSYVVFQRLDNVTGDSAIFRMDPDGSHVRRLTPWKLEADTQDLSPATRGPTKNLVAFETYGHGGPPPGKSQNLATVPSTCAPVSACRKQIRYVTHHHGGPSQSFNPSWSPNGRRIAYVRFRDHPCCVGDIWTMRPDGSHGRPVSRSRLFEYRPDWGEAPRG